MLAKNGFLDLEEVMDIPGFPGMETLKNKKCAVIECKQNIPCNPCESACPHHAITIGNPITNLPVVDSEKCIGCGLCVAQCPGQACFLVDMSKEEYDTVTLPYEYYPLPEKNQEVYGLGRDGKYLVKAEVLRVVLTKKNDRTAVIEVKVPKALEIISPNAAGISFILIIITITVIRINPIVINGTINSAVLAIRLIPPEITIKSNTAIIAPVIYCEMPRLFLNPLVIENACGATVRIGTQINVNTA